MHIDVVQPIPDLSDQRRLHGSYRQTPIDYGHPQSKDPVVALSEYGVQGVNYYSQPNNATIDPVPGVSPDVYLRRTVAEKLAKADQFLQTSPQVAWALGEPARLYVRDGWRSPELCNHLFKTVIPELISRTNPDWEAAKVQEETKKKIANPDWSEQSVPPHFTGGAADLILVTAESGEVFNTGFKAGHLASEAVQTDYLERLSDEELAQEGLEQSLITRRVLYAVMTSAAPEVGGVSMASNPVETWHYSLGDQLWAQLTGQPAAFYGVPADTPADAYVS